ncbi:hypothetical protein BSZ39_09485 [Bowdeniella nasicola]|uniref:General stress protein 17M-like domain-containing protein n=2 Tax=Bowdeniella nasicola TaxID=208480 RepID=A0A1Q5Q123_9ACTO|nr:hypothetical protein BSZ39_09485 [Bowdeniella nasicola]
MLTPTIPQGVELASFDTYLAAQEAVDALSDAQFPVQHTSIIGTDLKMVERIIGRLTLTRASMAGAGTGAWLGLMYGILMWIVMPEGAFAALAAGLIIGVIMGAVFGAVSYLMTQGRRDFTSSSQVVAQHYAVICDPEHAGKAREILSEAGIKAAAPMSSTPPPAVDMSRPPQYGIRLDEDGNPIEH